MTESERKFLEKLRKLGSQWPELIPLLQNCRSDEDIEQAIVYLKTL